MSSMETILGSLKSDGVVVLPDLYFPEITAKLKRKQALAFKEKRIVTCDLGDKLLPLVRAYYGWEPKLVEAEHVITRPSPRKEEGSQLWHRDGHFGGTCLRAFCYQTDVTLEDGPFCYAPGTHPFGWRHMVYAGRVGDEEFGKIVPESEWRTITGPKGTTFIADLWGYHKGWRNLSGERQIICVSYYKRRATNYA
jgi:hypothetical protein